MQLAKYPTVDEFTEAFIAALIDRRIISIDPNSESTNLGISRVYALLDSLAGKAKDINEKRWLLRVKNVIAPSNIGTNDYFLSALRACQLGFTASPNPRYSEILFKLSRPHAQDFLSKIQKSLRTTAESAADVFLTHESEPAREKAERGGDDIEFDSGFADCVVQ